jgi:hypothetical protein
MCAKPIDFVATAMSIEAAAACLDELDDEGLGEES